MKLNSLRFRIIYLILFIIACIIAAYRLPAYINRLPWFIVLVISDLYIYQWLYKPDIRIGRSLRITLVFFTFLPSFMILCFFLSLAIFSPLDWNPVLRTYLLALASLFYLIRLFPLCILLLTDVRKVVVSVILRKKTGYFKIRLPIIVSLIMSFFTAVLYLLGMFYWVYNFQIVEKEVCIKGLPEDFDGYRIVHISDFHLGRWHSKEPLKRAFNMVNSLDPDMIAFTGDLVNYATVEAQPFKEILAGINAKDGIFAVMGNHDYGDYLRWNDADKKTENLKDLQKLYKDLGWVLLDNTNNVIIRKNSRLFIAGTGNFSTSGHYPDYCDLNATLRNIPDSGRLVLLTHNPRIISEIKTIDRSFDLVLSGHTHGLQFGISLCKREFSPALFIFKYWGGFFEIHTNQNQKINLYVNRGLGHIAFPARIGIKPEITLLILKAA
ncbi:MAG: hypothetical protein GX128_01545 [Bacteroidales bacterium]|nr:hypothetical protein [Bacteroidales bacterium]